MTTTRTSGAHADAVASEALAELLFAVTLLVHGESRSRGALRRRLAVIAAAAGDARNALGHSETEADVLLTDALAGNYRHVGGPWSAAAIAHQLGRTPDA